jgi:type IV pilus assembly protein PilW
MRPETFRNRPPARGFTLVEIMVGLVLGLLATIIMYQVFTVFEGQRRTTVSGGNAQSAGHLSMYAIERDVRLAGLGLIYVSRPDFFEYSGEITCPGGVRTFSASAGGVSWADGARPTVPVRVGEGGANPDSFTVLYGPSAVGGGAPAKLASPVNPGTLAGGFLVSNAPWIDDTAVPPVNAFFRKDDIIMIGQPAIPGHPCVRLKISSISKDAGTGLPLIRVDPGANYDENPTAADFAAFLPAAGYDLPDAIVTHMGGSLARVDYVVDAATMQLQANGTPVADGVVSLQVRYGIGPDPGATAGCSLKAVEPACQTVATWADAVATGGVDWGNLSGTDAVTLRHIKRIKAVRIAVVTRSQNLEKPDDNVSLYGAGREIAPSAAGCRFPGDYVEAPAPRICAWAGPSTGAGAVPLVDPSLAPDEAACAAQLGAPCWNRFRYKVYETVVPMRNVLWGTKNS